MPDTAQINRSLSSIKTELEFLQASNVLSPPQFQSIMAQLPVSNISVAHISGSLDFPDSSQGQNGNPSQYIDPRFTNPQQQFNPGQLAQQAQDPNNAAHPQNPNVRISTSSSLSIPPFLNSLSRVRNWFFFGNVTWVRGNEGQSPSFLASVWTRKAGRDSAFEIFL